MNKILVIDDDYAIRVLYEEELCEEGYEVVTSGECASILDTISVEMPDLIVLDVELGRFNGLDILTDIRNTFYQMPVILCSHIAEYRYDLRAIAADYFVIKRSDLRDLKLKIKMAMEAGLTYQDINKDSVHNKTDSFAVTA